jgi:hypothetical protein
MLTARNQRYRIAAAAAAMAWLVLAGGEVIDAVHLFGADASGRFTASAVLYIAAHVVGAGGWLLVAVAFADEVDWWLLRLGAIVVGTGYAVYFAGWLTQLIGVFADVHDGNVRDYYIASAIGPLLFAAGAFVAAAGLGERQRGAPRARALWLGAIALAVGSVAVTVGLLYVQSFYSAFHAANEVSIGALVAAVGTFLTAVAGLVFVRGARRPLAAREYGVTTAGAVAVVGTVVIAAGEALTAVAYLRDGGAAWQQVVAWLAVASRLVLAAAFIALALGAREAWRRSRLDLSGAA